MPLQSQLLPIQIGGGVDTKSDDKKVISSKLLVLENGIFTQPGKINKRNGYAALPLTISGGGTITNPKAIKVLNNDLVCAAENSNSLDSGRLFNFSTDLHAWVDKGKYIPCKDSVQFVGADSPQKRSTAALMDSFLVLAWAAYTNSANVFDLYVTIQDVTTNGFVYPETLVTASIKTVGTQGTHTGPTAVRLSNSAVGIFYVNSVSDLVVKVVSFSGSTISISGETVVQSPAVTSHNANVYDVASTATGAALVSRAAGNWKVFLINPAGATTNSAVVSAATADSYYSVKVDPTNGNIWLYFGTDFYAIYSSALAVVLAATATGPFSAIVTGRLVVAVNSTTQQTVYVNNSTVDETQTYFFTVTSAGVVGTFTTFLYDVKVVAAPIQKGKLTLLPVWQYRQVQSGLVFVDVSDKNAVVNALSGLGLFWTQTGVSGQVFVPIQLSASKFVIPMTYGTQTTSLGSLGPLGTALITLDFADPDIDQAIQLTDSLIWNGGIITQYDGQSAVELGFIVFPEVLNSSAQTTGGSIADGTYSYQVVYQWLDNMGRLHQSAPSIPFPITITAGGGTAAVNLIIKPLMITAKQGTRFPVKVTIFRTTNNGTIYHQVNNIDLGTTILYNTPGANITYTDTASDAIAFNPTIYTTGGVVDNIIPPPGLQMTIYNNRLWLVDSEDPTNVWYSKSVTPGVGLSFSDLLTINVDQRQGEITALAGMDDKIVFFKSVIPFFSVGDGANDTGNGATLSLPQVVASDVGCIASKSIILNMPLGIMFKSQKGIYMMDRSLQVQYIGREVESFNSEVVTSAVLNTAKSQIRFLTSSGSSLLYDYIYNQWSTFTNHIGLGADIWQGNYTYCRVDGDIYNETPGVFLDKATAISLKIGTAWIKLTDLQNFQRIWNFFVLGDYKSKHLLNGQITFDYETTPFSTFTFNPQTVLGLNGDDTVYQFRYHMERQKCESVKFTIFDSFTGFLPGEGYSLSQFSIEAGIKQGGNKLSPFKSVG